MRLHQAIPTRRPCALLRRVLQVRQVNRRSLRVASQMDATDKQ